MVAALTLLQNDIPVRIIDKNPNHRIGQRAPGIWVCDTISTRWIALRTYIRFPATHTRTL